MKKARIIFFLLCTIQLVSACKNIPPIQSITANGTLQEQGITTYQYGTHVLNDKDGKTLYALKSKTLKLDTYVGKQVELQGVVVEGYPVDGGPPYLEVVKIIE